MRTHQIKGSFANANPAHTVVDASWPQPLLGDGKTCPFCAQQVGLGHAHVVVHDLGVAGPACPRSPITEVLRTSRKPGVSVGTMIWLARLCLAASGLVTAMTMAKAAPSAAGGEPFVAGDDVVVAVGYGRGAHPGRVGAGIFRFGHGKAGCEFPLPAAV